MKIDEMVQIKKSVLDLEEKAGAKRGDEIFQTYRYLLYRLKDEDKFKEFILSLTDDEYSLLKTNLSANPVLGKRGRWRREHKASTEKK